MSLSDRFDITLDQASAAPTNKVLTGGIGSAVAVIAAFVYQSVTGDVLPAGVEGAVATLVYALVSYLVPNSPLQP